MFFKFPTKVADGNARILDMTPGEDDFRETNNAYSLIWMVGKLYAHFVH